MSFNKYKGRYTIYMYSETEWCVDCETCDAKVCNIKPEQPLRHLELILNHEKTLHATT